MSLNIGTLVGYLQLDDQNFARKADNADRKINALKLHLEALGRENPKIGVEVNAQTEQLDLLKAKLADLKVQAENGVDVRVDAVQALVELDRVQTKIRELHGKTVKVNVDTDKSKLDSLTSDLDKLGSKLGVIPALAVAGTSALIPLVGVLGGLGAALGAPLLLAAGGATVFGFLASFAVKDTEKQLKAIDTLGKHLGTLTKGTAAYAATQKQLRDAEKALTPEQQKFIAAQDKLKHSFQDFLGGNGGQSLLVVMAQGMTLLGHLLPVVSPLILAVGNGLSTLLGDIDRAGQGQGLQRFVEQISHLIGPDIVAGGHMLINLASGVGTLLLTLSRSHMSHEVISGLVGLTDSFDSWSRSSSARHDVRELFAYVHQVGPQVGHTLAAIAGAAGHLVKALAPLGPPVLKVVEGIANAISAIPVPVLTAMAAAFIAVTAAAKVAGPVGSLVGKLGDIGSLGGALGGKGGIAGKVFGRGVVPVYVTNEGFGGGGNGPGGIAGGLAGDAEGAGKGGGLLSRVKGLLPFAFQAPALMSVGDIGNEAPGEPSLFNTLFHGAKANAGIGDLSAFLKATSTPVHLTSTSTALNALKAHAQQASQTIDQIGPHAAAAFSAASKDVDNFRAKLAAIQDKRIAVILQDQAAIQSLEALQRLRLRDKYLTVYERSQRLDQAVGPGGGIGRHAGGGWIIGPGSGVSDSVPFLGSNGEFVIRAAQAAANAPLVQAINNGSGRISLSSAALAHGAGRRGTPDAPTPVLLVLDDGAQFRAHIETIAGTVAHADRRYAESVGGMR